MTSIIRTTDGKVTIVDEKIGTVTAPSECEAWNELARRSARPPLVDAYSPMSGKNTDALWWRA